MSQANVQICSVCQVKITAKDQVIFSAGAPGTRGKLWARVCQYAKKPGCINQDPNLIGIVKDEDHYRGKN